MDDTDKTGKIETTPTRRRAVVTAASAAATFPAVALLLNAASKNAFAQITRYGPRPPTLDNSTFGNSAETIDSPLGGPPSQDDHI